MTCAEIDAHIEALFDGAIDPTLKNSVKTHLSICPSCAERLERMQAMRILMRKIDVPRPLRSLDARVMGAFQERHAPSQASTAWWRRLIFGTVLVPKPALAMSLVAVCLALFVGIQVGRLSGTQIVMTFPTSPAYIGSAPVTPSQANVEPIARQPIVTQRTALPRNESRPSTLLRSESHPSMPRKAPREVFTRTARTKPLESFTVISSSGTNYSTSAALVGFDPVTGTKARVIKREEEK